MLPSPVKNEMDICYVQRFILIIKPNRYTTVSILFFGGINLYVFRAVPLSIIRSFSLYTQQWFMSASLYDINHFCVYSEKLLMMDRGTARNM